MGRFTSVDPGNAGAKNEDPQSWNAYAYGRNNPIVFIDPDGLSYTLCDNDGNCIYDYDDIAFAQNFKGAADIQLVTTSTGAGQIYANGELIGTYQYNGFFYDGIEEALGNQADATMDLIGSLATDAVIGGVAGYGVGKVVQSGIRAISSYKGAQQVGNEAKNLITSAAQTIGNKGVVASSKEAALVAAEEWVGIGARPLYKGGKIIGKISADGQRVYRTTSINKPRPYINLVNRTTGGNLHVRF